ncbi:MAG TPA: RecQ family ATP-dependent DNA helicase [Flavobacteriia bacterium]|nr:RecQ family ATP-dependent DNA helicase [Flavobacteriia bacterium]
MDALKILQKYWKFDQFRLPQEEIINAVIQKKDVIALLPTGGGKSICYQVPGLMQEGTCLVVSPLIALMQDQVAGLEKRGIKAIAITSKLNENEIITAFDNLIFGKTKFLYLSPEKLQSVFIQQKLKQLNINLIAIDEAHCISEWGHDFRLSYLKIKLLRELFPAVPMLALTATATDRVVLDIQKYLHLSNPEIFKKSFVRKNLAYQIYKTEDTFFKLKQMLTKIKQPAIVYVYTRKQTKEISDLLNQNNFESSYYHGGMLAEEKEKSYQNWMQEITPIMVATNAFGMGIDKDNVKLVVHLNIPQSIENYMQEAGRAGRNGKKSFAVLLYNDTTIYNFEKQIAKSILPIYILKDVYFYLNQHFRIGLGEIPDESFVINIPKFCNKYALDVLQTFNALTILDREGVLVFDSAFQKKSSVQFVCKSDELFRYKRDKKQLKQLIQLLLRYYGGIFDNPILIDEYFFAKKLQLPKWSVENLLAILEKDGIVNYNKKRTVSTIRFLVMREDDKVINRISKSVHQRNELKINKKSAILNYVTNNKVCRNIQLLDYFKENEVKKCGVCDVCLAEKKSKTDINSVINSIFELLDKKAHSIKDMVFLLPFSETEIISSTQFLLENDKIKLTKSNQYIIKKEIR